MMALAAAIQFLLISPAFVKRPFTPAELGRSTAFYPPVGLLLGGVLAGVDLLLAYVFPIQVRSALVLVLWIVLTGALHFDGLLDSADGLLGGGTVERRMQIMRDEQTGAYAAATGVLILLTMFSALNAIEPARWAALHRGQGRRARCCRAGDRRPRGELCAGRCGSRRARHLPQAPEGLQG